MKSALSLFLLAGAMLISCGGNTPSSQQPADSSAEASSAVSSATYLDWVADNKIVIDLYSVGMMTLPLALTAVFGSPCSGGCESCGASCASRHGDEEL